MAGRTVSIDLGGQTRELKYDLNAISTIGERLNIQIRLGDLSASLLQHPLPLSAIRTLLWAGLQWRGQPPHNEAVPSEEEVGSWVDTDNIQEVLDRFFTLFGVTFSVRDIMTTTSPTTDTGEPNLPKPSTSSNELPPAPSSSSPTSSGA